LEFEEGKQIFGVFDGHGGGEVAKFAKKHFEEGLRKIEEFKQSDFKEGLRKGFLQVDIALNNGGLDEVAQTKRENPPAKSPLMKILGDVTGKNRSAAAAISEEEEDDLALDSIGCTANVVMIDYHENKVWVANAGDSRCVMGRSGTCVPLSFDHKPECEVEIARIQAAGSVITEGRVDGHLNLTRALGDLKFKKKPGLTAEQHCITANPDVFEYEFNSECDFILMGCDGVWETKSNEEMVQWVYKRLGDAPDKSPASLK